MGLREKNIFLEYDIVGFIVNDRNEHWLFIEIDNQNKKIVIKDSMKHNFKHYAQYQKILNKIIELEFKNNNLIGSSNFTNNYSTDIFNGPQ